MPQPLTSNTPLQLRTSDATRRAITACLTSWSRTCVAAGAVWLCAGCSFVFVTPPPSKQATIDSFSTAKPQKECTTNRTAPVLDVIATGLQVARTVFAIAADDSVYNDPNQPLSREADIVLGVAFTTLHFSSAAYGFSNTSECRKRTSGIGVDDYEPPPSWMTRETGAPKPQTNATVSPPKTIATNPPDSPNPAPAPGQASPTPPGNATSAAETAPATPAPPPAPSTTSRNDAPAQP